MILRVHVVCKLCVTANGSYSSVAISLFVVAPIVYVAFVSVPDFITLFIASILGPKTKEMSRGCNCSASFLCDAVDLSLICECDIARSYQLKYDTTDLK